MIRVYFDVNLFKLFPYISAMLLSTDRWWGLRVIKMMVELQHIGDIRMK